MKRWVFICLLLFPLSIMARTQPEFPQAKIDRVDANNPSQWRIFMSLLGEGGQPLNLMEHNVSLFLTEGARPVRMQGATPIGKFTLGLADQGFDGRMLSLAKAKVQQAVVIVVSLHTDIGPEVRSLLSDILPTILEGLQENAQISVLFYNDRIMTLWSPDGIRAELRDINDYQNCLFTLRQEASTSPKEDGAVGCGRMFSSPEMVIPALAAIPPGQGLFPRFFGIDEAPEVRDESRKKGHSRMDEADIARGTERFANGALEAAMRILSINSSSFDVREIILLSDGRDGYMRIADIISEYVAPGCRKDAPECTGKKGRRPQIAPDEAQWEAIPGMDHEGGSKGCTKAVLACAIPKIANVMRVRENTVAEHMQRLIQALRSRDIRISAIAIPGSDQVGQARLHALAFKTGGTYRNASQIAQFKPAAAALSLELASQVVVLPKKGLTPNTRYTMAAMVPDLDLVTENYGFQSSKCVFFFEKPIHSLRSWMIKTLGHTFGPIAFVVLLVLGALAAIGMVFSIVKLVQALLGKAKDAGKSKLKPPPKPKMPQAKIPGAKIPPVPKPK